MNKIGWVEVNRIINEFLKRNPKIERSELHYRYDRQCIEWVCEHGIGHPIWDAHGDYVHECDGCCKKSKHIPIEGCKGSNP